jgi:hypothetical protein
MAGVGRLSIVFPLIIISTISLSVLSPKIAPPNFLGLADIRRSPSNSNFYPKENQQFVLREGGSGDGIASLINS